MMKLNIREISGEAGGRLIYLASPYSDDNPEIRELRFRQVCYAAAGLMQKGLFIFSPIAHSHPIAEFGLPKDWEYWEAFDRLYLEACAGMIVLNLPGWMESKGVQAEMVLIHQMEKKIWHMDPQERGA